MSDDHAVVCSTIPDPSTVQPGRHQRPASDCATSGPPKPEHGHHIQFEPMFADETVAIHDIWDVKQAVDDGQRRQQLLATKSFNAQTSKSNWTSGMRSMEQQAAIDAYYLQQQKQLAEQLAASDAQDKALLVAGDFAGVQQRMGQEGPRIALPNARQGTGLQGYSPPGSAIGRRKQLSSFLIGRSPPGSAEGRKRRSSVAILQAATIVSPVLQPALPEGGNPLPAAATASSEPGLAHQNSSSCSSPGKGGKTPSASPRTYPRRRATQPAQILESSGTPPRSPRRYTSQQYGASWFVPQSNWSWLQSARCAARGPYTLLPAHVPRCLL